MKTHVLFYFLIITTSFSQSGNFLGLGRGFAPEDPRQAAVDSAGTNVFRFVDGKLYNVVNSTNWETIPFPSSHQTTVETVFENKLIIAQDTGNEYKTLMITNHPRQKTALSGDSLSRFRAMKIDRVDYLGRIVPLYDWGFTPQQVATNKSSTTTTNQLKKSISH